MTDNAAADDDDDTRCDFGDDDDNCQAAEGTGEPGTKSSFEKNKDKGD